jgi:DNA-binding NarL/FixJ family response regulator
MTNKKIATRVPVSPAAINKRLAIPYAKLNAHDRGEAVTEAVAKDIIPPPSH